MRAAGTPPVHIAGRGQDGGLQLHRGVVYSCPSPFWHPLSIPNRLRDADAQGNPDDLSDKPSTEPGYLQCVKVCGTWAVKDLDFPKAGPWEFSFQLPPSFVADGDTQTHRPKPEPFPKDNTDGAPNWTTMFDRPARYLTTREAMCFYKDPLPG